MITGVDLSVRQFTGAWKLMAAGCPGRHLETGDGLEYVFTGLPVAFFNTVFVTAPTVTGDDLRRYGRQARAWAAGHDVPWLFVVTLERVGRNEDPAEALEACGLARIMRLTGMQADHVPPLATVPEGLRLVVPNDDAQCESLLDVNASAYGTDLSAGKDSFGRRRFWEGQFPVLGLADGRPVCCAAVMMVEGLRYVALVATAPAYQRRGFADAAMRRALELSAKAHGETPTVLHATDAGFPVYERMGYRTISTHGVFMERRFVDGH